jgi:hypothetical protein
VRECDRKTLRLLGIAPEKTIAKPLYGQKLYRGFESPPLRQTVELQGESAE